MITNITFKPTLLQKIKMKFCRHRLEDVSLQGYQVAGIRVKYFCIKCGIKKLGWIFSPPIEPNILKESRAEWATKTFNH